MIWGPTEASVTRDPLPCLPCRRPQLFQGLWRKRPGPKKPPERGTMGFAVRPPAYMPHSRAQPHRVSRAAEGSRARALGPAWEVSQSIFRRVVGHRGGRVPQAGWDSWLCCPRFAVLVRAEAGEPGQGAWRAWSIPPGAGLQRTPAGVCAQGPGGNPAGPAGLGATRCQRPVWHHLWREGSRVGLSGKP